MDRTSKSDCGHPRILHIVLQTKSTMDLGTESEVSGSIAQ